MTSYENNDQSDHAVDYVQSPLSINRIKIYITQNYRSLVRPLTSLVKYQLRRQLKSLKLFARGLPYFSQYFKLVNIFLIRKN